MTATPAAPPIIPGGSIHVRFGGAGSPSTPTDCRLNGTPCTFVSSPALPSPGQGVSTSSPEARHT